MLPDWSLLQTLSTDLDYLVLNSFDVFNAVQYHALGRLAYDLRYIIDDAAERNYNIDDVFEFLITSYKIKLNMYDVLANHPKFTSIRLEINEAITDILDHLQ